MRANWEALHGAFVQSVLTSRASRQFRQLASNDVTLGRFLEPAALLEYLDTRSGDLAGKNTLYKALVRRVQAGGELAALASSLLWLGLWPGLDAIFREQSQRFGYPASELTSDLAGRFTTAVSRADLTRIHRVAATLVLNTRRALIAARKRAKKEEGLLVDVDVSAFPDMDFTEADAHDRSETESRRKAKVAALRRQLVEVFGRDAELVLRTQVFKMSQREAADLLGISYEVARKRLQRIRRRLQGSESHFPALGPHVPM
jgi:DNA-directed RNA polymerase specialized sigma24 family protein